MRHARARETGFTLVEVLVALVIAALLLSIILGAQIAVAERRQRIESHVYAMMVARDVMAHELVAPFAAGQRTGSFDGVAWQVDERALSTDPEGRFALSEMRVTVTDARAVKSAISRLRIKAVPQ